MDIKFQLSDILLILLPIVIIYFFTRVKCVRCGHKGLLRVNKQNELECKKCGFNYGPDDFGP
jgi:Zn ribbon nucleic-acid-binding protein